MMLRKICSAMLAFSMVLTPVSVFAQDGSNPSILSEDGKLTEGIGNITQVNNLYQGFYVPLNQPITVNYKIESSGEHNGESVDPTNHVVKQTMYWNGEQVYTAPAGGYYTNEFTPTTLGSGYIETTWDNGMTEKDGIATLLFVIVNYYDEDTMEELQNYKYIPLTNISFYSGSYDGISPTTWDASSLDQLAIDGYTYSRSENITGALTSVSGEYNVYANVYYKKQFIITYTDGVDNEEVFADQTTKVSRNAQTPAYNGTPTRKGYEFIGWSPKVETTVTQDATYVAQWKKVDTKQDTEDHKATPSNTEEKKKVTNKKVEAKKTSEVKTGIENNLGLYVSMLGFAMAASVIVCTKKK